MVCVAYAIKRTPRFCTLPILAVMLMTWVNRAVILGPALRRAQKQRDAERQRLAATPQHQFAAEGAGGAAQGAPVAPPPSGKKK